MCASDGPQFKMYSVHEPKVHSHSLSMCLGEDGYRTRWTFSVCEGSRRRGVTKDDDHFQSPGIKPLPPIRKIC